MPPLELHTYFTDIQVRFAYEFAWDPDPDNWSSDQDTLFSECLLAGQRQFYFPPVVPGDRQPHRWNFLRRSTPITGLPTINYTSSGAISLLLSSSGALSLDSEQGSPMFPSVAANGGHYVKWTDDSITGIPLARIVTSPGDETATVDITGYSASSSDFSFIPLYYPLPDDFGGTEAVGFTYDRTENVQGSIPIIADEEIQKLDHFGRESDYPEAASITAMPVVERSGGSFEGTRYFARFFPQIPEGKKVNLNYFSSPHSIAEGSKNIPDGAAIHSEAILASIIDKGHELILHENTHHARFLELLKASVELDRRYNAFSSSGQGAQSDGGYDYDTTGQIHEAIKYRRQLMPYSNMTLNFGG